MGVRRIRGARLRRAARSRPLALLALYGAAAVVATAPAVGRFRASFIAGGAAGLGEAGAGDHLQTLHRFWLVGHQLEHGAAPWRDPYSFQPLADAQANLGGWPFGLPFWPLHAVFGPVIAWNVLLLSVIVLAGLATYGWLRALELPVAAAIPGGLAFAIAPYRLVQSEGHLLGWISAFLPLALWAFERSRAAGTRRSTHAFGAISALALLTIPLSGNEHLAVGALPFCVLYALLRFRTAASCWLLSGAAAGFAAGLVVRLTVIAGSSAATGRSLDQVRQFEADWVDLVSRFRRHGLEQFSYVGWLTPLLALLGLAVLARRRRGLAALLGIAAIVPLVFALGTHTPIYAPIWEHFPPLHYTRVPGRLLPVATLALAALTAFAVAFVLRTAAPRWRPVLAVAVALLVAGDLLVLPFRATAADPDNAAYAALARSGPGRTVELPLFEPGIHFGSIYLYYQLQEQRQRPGGYSTLAPPAAYAHFWELNRLNCGILRDGDLERLRRLGVRELLFHTGAYAQAGRASPWHAWQALQRAGLRAVATGNRVALLPLAARSGLPIQAAPVPEPDHEAPVLCEGWRGFTMKERDAPLWVYTGTDVDLAVTSPATTEALVWVDNRRPRTVTVPGDGELTIHVELTTPGWHSIVLSVPRLLLNVKPPQGLTLTQLRYMPIP